jgi:AbrB family looped-hinge helix DNA binding protein
MSSKGQVVIPEDIRRQLRLKAGSQFVVLGKGDVVILKAIAAPAMEEFGALIAAARKQAKHAGMKQPDVAAAVARVRGQR